jgi:hypothetical protein
MEVSGQLHASAALPREKSVRYQSDRRLGGPTAGVVAVEERKIPNSRRKSNSRIPIVQPVGSRYTDWAIPALSFLTLDSTNNSL